MSLRRTGTLPPASTPEALREDIAAARRTQIIARDRDDLYLETAATWRIDRALDQLLRLKEDS